MDNERSQFFWRGADKKFKYHMVKWENVCLPKYMGALGIINTRLMNEALLVKWIWRIQVNDLKDFCVQILRKKYLSNDTFFRVSQMGGCQFWTGLHKIKRDVKRGLICQVNNGKDKESILGGCAAWRSATRLQYPALYRISDKERSTVYECVTEDEWDLGFRRNLTQEDGRN